MTIRRTSARSLAALAVPLLLSAVGCVSDVEPAQEAEPESDVLDVTPEEEESIRVDLPDGAFIEFHAHFDGSYSVSEEGDAYHRSVMNRPEFEEATPLALFEAITDRSVAIPASLIKHHEALVADGFVIDSGEQQERGWLLPELENPLLPLASNPCPGHVSNFVCASSQAGNYPDGPGCYPYVLDATWNGAHRVRRYRTGFCTTGTADVYIKPRIAGTNHPSCWAPRIGFFPLRDGHYTNHNYAYAWWGPSGSWPRKYNNSVQRVSGPGVSWGVREKRQGSSCQI